MRASKSGREREAERILKANRAAVVARLMLGEMKDWQEFFEPDRLDLLTLPRKQLKSGKYDIQTRLRIQLERFCENNFVGMKESILAKMYDEIKAYRGLHLPLLEFESRFAQIKQSKIEGNPSHLTVSISLWGLQYMFPEDFLSKDIVQALEIAQNTKEKLAKYKRKTHSYLQNHRTEINQLLRQSTFVSRSGLLACFNLIEAYLNGLAWAYLRTKKAESLSNRQRKKLDDSSSLSIREKIIQYPKIIADVPLFDEADPLFDDFINSIKPFRDSLVHPSPFDAPQKFGGYNKLQKFYEIDYEIFQKALSSTLKLITRIHNHVHGQTAPLPRWLCDLASMTEQLLSSENGSSLSRNPS
jgi:hypothetical protein